MDPRLPFESATVDGTGRLVVVFPMSLSRRHGRILARAPLRVSGRTYEAKGLCHAGTESGGTESTIRIGVPTPTNLQTGVSLGASRRATRPPR